MLKFIRNKKFLSIAFFLNIILGLNLYFYFSNWKLKNKIQNDYNLINNQYDLHLTNADRDRYFIKNIISQTKNNDHELNDIFGFDKFQNCNKEEFYIFSKKINNEYFEYFYIYNSYIYKIGNYKKFILFNKSLFCNLYGTYHVVFFKNSEPIIFYSSWPLNYFYVR